MPRLVTVKASDDSSCEMTVTTQTTWISRATPPHPHATTDPATIDRPHIEAITDIRLRSWNANNRKVEAVPRGTPRRASAQLIRRRESRDNKNVLLRSSVRPTWRQLTCRQLIANSHRPTQLISMVKLRRVGRCKLAINHRSHFLPTALAGKLKHSLSSVCP